MGKRHSKMLTHEYLKRAFEPEFSHGEALFIADVTADQLQTWNKRGIATDDSERESRRGIRRKYSLQTLAKLTILKELSELGVPLSYASAYVSEVAASAFLATLPLVLAVATGETQLRLLLVAYQKHIDGLKVTAFELLTDKDPQIEVWLKNNGLRGASVVDLVEVGFLFRHRLEKHVHLYEFTKFAVTKDEPK